MSLGRGRVGDDLTGMAARSIKVGCGPLLQLAITTSPTSILLLLPVGQRHN